MSSLPRLVQRLLFKVLEPAAFFQLVQRIFFQIIRYPCCPQAYIERHIDLPGTPRQEVRLYSRFSNQSPHLMNWMMGVFALYAAKNANYLYFTLGQLDFHEPHLNMHKQQHWKQETPSPPPPPPPSPSSSSAASATTTTQQQQINNSNNNITILSMDPQVESSNDGFNIVCLRANCNGSNDITNYFRLADELVRLPLFSICKPHLRWLFVPAIGSQTIGLLYMAEYTMLSVILCILYPLFVYLTPITQNLTIMFQLCPVANLNVLRRDIPDYLIKLSLSEINHYQWTKDLLKDVRYRLAHGLALKRIEKLRQDNYDALQDMELSDYIDDCLPINRTEWWRWNMLRTFAYLFLLTFITWTQGLGWLVGYLIQNSIEWHHKHALDVIERANSSIGCHLRVDIPHLNHDNGLAGELQEAHIRLDWSVYAIIESVVVFIFPFYIVSLTIVNYYYICKDEKVCIIELEEQLKTAVNFRILTKQLDRQLASNEHQSHKLDCSSMLAHKEPVKQCHFRMSTIRERLIQRVNFDWCIFMKRYESCEYDGAIKGLPIVTNLCTKLEEQRFAWQLVQVFGTGREVYHELLEKLYVNWLQFLKFLDQNHQGIGNVLIFNSLLNYGFTLIAVYFYRNLQGFVLAPVLMTAVALSAIIYLIAIASDIHSSLIRQVQPLIWTLIAENIDSTDEKIKLLSSLLLRQMIFIERSGGLGNRFQNWLITYVGIIKMLLWTSTILTVLIR